MNKQVAHEMRQDPIFGSKQHRKGLSSTDTKLQSASATSIQQSGLPQPIKQAFEHHKSALFNVISEETKSAARKPNFAEAHNLFRKGLQERLEGTTSNGTSGHDYQTAVIGKK